MGSGDPELDISGQTLEQFLSDTLRAGRSPLPSGGILGPLFWGVPKAAKDGSFLHRPIDLETIGLQPVRFSKDTDGTVNVGKFSYTSEEILQLGDGYVDPGIARLAVWVVTNELIEYDQPRPFDQWLSQNVG